MTLTLEEREAVARLRTMAMRGGQSVFKQTDPFHWNAIIDRLLAPPTTDAGRLADELELAEPRDTFCTINRGMRRAIIAALRARPATTGEDGVMFLPAFSGL